MLDYSRLAVTVNLGTRDVAPNAEFEAGAIVALDSNGAVVKADGATPLGVAKWNRTLILSGVIIDEEIVLEGTNPANLKHPLLKSGSVKVTNTARNVIYEEGTDYSVNYTNGQITRIDTGSIPSGATVLVSYTYQLSEIETKVIRGTNYVNTTDDTLGSGKITVIENWAEIYTDQFDTSKTYTPGQQLYVGVGEMAGRFTTDNASGKPYGIVYKAPTPDDPYLGVILK